MIDGPHSGWKPTHQDWYRIKFGTALYVGKNGVLSPMEINCGAHPKFRPNEEHKDSSLPTPESCQEMYPMGGLMGNDDPGVLRQMLGMDGPTGYGAIRPGDLPPTDFFKNPSFFDSPQMSTSLESSGLGGPDTPDGVSETSGIRGTRIAGGDSSSMLPVELMIYNDLMTGIEGSARFLGQEFQDSVLFGPAPTSSPTPAGQHPNQGPQPQSPSTVYGWVLPSV